ncbi:MAG: hypothetical protein ABF649_20080 [Bacillus sp. (in: firmicutes)]
MGKWSKLSISMQRTILFLFVFSVMLTSYMLIVEKRETDNKRDNIKEVTVGNPVTDNKGKIEDISDTEINISGVKYEYAVTLRAILRAENKMVLKQAEVEFTVNNNKIDHINRIQLQSSGASSTVKAANYLVLSGDNKEFNGDIVVNADYIMIRDININGNFTSTDQNNHFLYLDNVQVEDQTLIASKGQVFLKDTHLNKVSNEANLVLRAKSEVEELKQTKEATVIVEKQAVINKYIPIVNNSTLSLYGEIKTIEADTSFLLTGTGTIRQLLLEKHSSLSSIFTGEITNLLLPNGKSPQLLLVDYDELIESIEKVNGKLVDNNSTVSEFYKHQKSEALKVPENNGIKSPDIKKPVQPSKTDTE